MTDSLTGSTVKNADDFAIEVAAEVPAKTKDKDKTTTATVDDTDETAAWTVAQTAGKTIDPHAGSSQEEKLKVVLVWSTRNGLYIEHLFSPVLNFFLFFGILNLPPISKSLFSNCQLPKVACFAFAVSRFHSSLTA
ncbi:hypothetical protein MHU86_5852 [Fragilaria crotonensis]|nr:hypothetical protein MHU86_5852 [Fragilaria crotonensis]